MVQAADKIRNEANFCFKTCVVWSILNPQCLCVDLLEDKNRNRTLVFIILMIKLLHRELTFTTN